MIKSLYAITEEEKQMILLSRKQKKQKKQKKQVPWRVGVLTCNLADFSAYADQVYEFKSYDEWQEILEEAFEDSRLVTGTPILFNSDGRATLDVYNDDKIYLSAEESTQIAQYVRFGHE